MLSLSIHPFELAFEYPFTIAKGTKTHQPTLIVSLGMGQFRGYGEAPAISYYGVTVDSMIESLKKKQHILQTYALTDPRRFWHFLEHLFPEQNFLIAALDIAGWDLFAQLRRMPLHHLLMIPKNPPPLCDYTIGIDAIEKMVAKVKAHPSPIYKIKIKSAEDIQHIEALRAATDKPFRVDANESLTFDEVVKLLPEFEKLGVKELEQPLKKTAWEAMQELKAQSPIDLYADESCVEEHDVIKCVNSFHGINIKLTKCGGITPALRMIKNAKQAGLKVMLGTMNESTVGTAALIHLQPLADALDADGSLLLKEDVAEGLRYEKGLWHTNDYTGLGLGFWGEKRERKLKS